VAAARFADGIDGIYYVCEGPPAREFEDASGETGGICNLMRKKHLTRNMKTSIIKTGNPSTRMGLIEGFGAVI
jgi:hypothetical protein